MPGMRRTTMRFGVTAHEVISEAAAAEGITFSQYVREAALVRAAIQAARTGNPMLATPDLLDEVHRARAIIREAELAGEDPAG